MKLEVKKALSSFGLNLANDFIAIVTDVCATMKNITKNFNIIQILCYIHGIHCSVIEFFKNLNVEVKDLKKTVKIYEVSTLTNNRRREINTVD